MINCLIIDATLSYTWNNIQGKEIMNYQKKLKGIRYLLIIKDHETEHGKVKFGFLAGISFDHSVESKSRYISQKINLSLSPQSTRCFNIRAWQLSLTPIAAQPMTCSAITSKCLVSGASPEIEIKKGREWKFSISQWKDTPFEPRWRILPRD